MIDPTSPVRACEYCGTCFEKHAKPAKCAECGAPLEDGREPYQPFFHRGYIVWPLEDFASATMEYHFYRGTQLEAIIPVGRDLLRTWARAYEGVDMFDETIFRLFELTKQEEGVVVFEDKVERSVFEIRVIKENCNRHIYKEVEALFNARYSLSEDAKAFRY